MQRILVVDDSANMRKMVIAALRPIADLDFGEARNGLEAIEQLAIAPVDLILLDINMPDMHGLEVLHFVSEHSDYSRVPIIVISTKGDDQSQRDAIAAGAVGYITKPFDSHWFVQHIQHLLLSV